MYDFDWDVVIDYSPLFIKGVGMTVQLTTIGIIFGMILGLILAFMRLSKNPLFNWPATIYLNIFRGTPLFVQLLVIHLAAIPMIFGTSQGPFFSGSVALALNSAAYISEIFRAGIKSIDKGQMEAARSLGMTHWMAMREIILPQAVKRMIPPFGNEFIMLLKDSSLVAVIAVHDLTQAGRMVMAATFKPWEAYLPVAVLYLMLTLPLTYLVAYLERRLETK
ncbi:amino acid ABC transporter permease [Desulfuribacillus stibiiarsenatis]|uniref:Amino acid ABC transporter permease n=1 Tax=Desulfuribacillus stibiiarsenatis TaxID=1390249 RepID=A0A1E5L9F0_9FIRM|nr:amino acid ABC transporter permease [Desulfuribacillus stibiiarsenatis]OEH86770.1 amino acid ABC transporter permease [Desulfuribacillus stibiiarsenatis]